MLWLIVAILSYFLFAVVTLIDKYLLVGPLPNPRVYSLYVGVLGIWALALIPFVDFLIPDPGQILLALSSGALFIFAVFWYSRGLRSFEASRIIPAIGGLNPLFIFGLTYFLGKENFGEKEGLAFLLLVAGSVFIVLQREKFVTLKSFQISAISALLFSLSFFFAKIVYSVQPFWSGLIWMRIGSFLAALSFIFSKEVREEIFLKRFTLKKKTAGIFLLGQSLGAGASILQNWAIFLAPMVYLAIINALQGVQYPFLFAFTTLISFKFPWLLKEEISKKVIIQKISAILFIASGIYLLLAK